MAQSLNCLLIDDDPEDQEIFLLALGDMSIQVDCRTANDGLQALEILSDPQQFTADLIFLDLNMPRMDGKECLVRMRQMPHLQTVPIIIYTTSKAEHHRAETIRLGGTHFYTKPTCITELSKALQAFFAGNFD